jgi:hypothetical protein
MDKNRIDVIENRITQIKQKLLAIGDMRPGSLTMQYKDPEIKKGGYYQISYTYKMKSRTEYVRPQFVRQTSRQIKTYKLFRELTEEWIALSIEKTKLLMLNNP